MDCFIRGLFSGILIFSQEILISAKHVTNVRDREKMINEAVLLCKEVAGKLCLEVLVSHLVGVHAYVAVVEICLVKKVFFKLKPKSTVPLRYTKIET